MNDNQVDKLITYCLARQIDDFAIMSLNRSYLYYKVSFVGTYFFSNCRFVISDDTLGPNAFARAYINFINVEDVFLFKVIHTLLREHPLMMSDFRGDVASEMTPKNRTLEVKNRTSGGMGVKNCQNSSDIIYDP